MREYSKYLRWASECCGVTKTKFDEMLKLSRSIRQAGREKALKELPGFLRAVGRKNADYELPIRSAPVSRRRSQARCHAAAT